MHEKKKLKVLSSSLLSLSLILAAILFSILLILVLLSSFNSTLNSFDFDSALAFPPTAPSNQTANDTSVATAVNHSPKANAGINQTVNENTTVVLNGIASDPDPNDDEKLTYLWKQITGPFVKLSNNTNTNPSFIAPTVASDRELRFSLTAKDDKGAESKNLAIVTVLVKNVNRSPLAIAGADQTASAGDIVTLDATKSKDPDNDELEYSWVQLAGPRVKLDNINTSIATFTAPSNISANINLVFKLTVKDDKNVSGTDNTKVIVKHIPPSNKPPIANASVGQTVNAGDTVQLDGSKSIDPDGNITSYSWSQIAGQDVVLNATNVAKPSFTAPSNISTARNVLLFQLTVTDDKSATGLSIVKVTVKPSNRAPVANAGISQTVNQGEITSLDGSKSNDPDGGPLTYTWRQTGGPSVTLNGDDKPIATFTTPRDISSDTDLTFELIVRDSINATDTANVKITEKYVPPPNKLPVANAGKDQVVNATADVTLDGSGSSDPDGDPLTYSWAQTSGPTVKLTDTDAIMPSFTAPNVSSNTILNFALTVKDDKGLVSLPASVSVSVNTMPLALADIMTTLANIRELNDKAVSLGGQGNYEEAITYFDKALAIDPNYKEALNGKGDALVDQGNYEEAITYFDKALAIDPNYKLALNNKGYALGGQGNYEEAITYYDKALAIDPNYKTALNNKGYALGGQGNYEEAITYFDKALAIDPNYKEALTNKGYALGGQGNYEEAITYFDKALAIDPNLKEALNGKGDALVDQGNYEEAITYYDKALAIDPNYKPASNGKVIALVYQGVPGGK
jgi:tetratricopeptide (TPR) repeat protein